MLTPTVLTQAPASEASHQENRCLGERSRWAKPSTETVRTRIMKFTPAQTGAMTYEPSGGAQPAPGIIVSVSPRSQPTARAVGTRIHARSSAEARL